MDMPDKMSDSLKEKVAGIVSLVGLSTWLIYWTGRWYKEWYFAQFGIPFELLTFDLHYYLFGSWATILVALSFIVAVIAILLMINSKGNINVLIEGNRHRLFRHVVVALLIMIVLLACLWVWLLYLPIQFNPSSTYLGKLLGSRDILLMALGAGCSLIAAIRVAYLKQELLSFYKAFAVDLQKHSILMILASFICMWIYLGYVGCLMGIYHGKAALSEGKMGLRWVKIKDGGAADQWWVLVTRTNDGRVFLYDKKTNKVKFVKDEAIQEIDGPITENPQAFESK